MKIGDIIVVDLTRETEKERAGGTERGGQVGEKVRVDARDTVAREDTIAGQTLEVDLGPNHLVYE
jgi:acyl dehydratase